HGRIRRAEATPSARGKPRRATVLLPFKQPFTGGPFLRGNKDRTRAGAGCAPPKGAPLAGGSAAPKPGSNAARKGKVPQRLLPWRQRRAEWQHEGYRMAYKDHCVARSTTGLRTARSLGDFGCNHRLVFA